MITVALAATLFLVAPAAAQTLQVHSLSLEAPAPASKPVDLRVVASDSAASVSGMVARFVGSDGLFGLAACSAARPPAAAKPPFARGSRVRLSAPHTFRSSGPQPVLARVQSGDCATQGSVLLQPATVTPTGPGEALVPAVLGTPVPLPAVGSPPLSDLPPGAGDLPPLPVIVPPIAAVVAAKCSGARRRPGPSRPRKLVARRALRCLLNNQRRKRGLRPLRVSPTLTRAALRQSQAMVRDRFFSHVQPTGVGLVDRVLKSGYLAADPGNWKVGENLAFGQGTYTSPLTQVRAWMASTPHRANILDRRFREVGIGVVDGIPADGSGATYTVVFGRRRG